MTRTIARLRWRIAEALNRLPGQCWADLAMWAAYSQRRLPWSPIGESCRNDLARNGACYCNKIQAGADSRTASSLLHRFARACRLFRRGLRYRYPLCCIVRFAWDAFSDRQSGVHRGATSARADGERWVPCNVLHHADPVDPRYRPCPYVVDSDTDGSA